MAVMLTMNAVNGTRDGGEMDSNIEGIDYGPLAGLLGTWTGDEGMDLSPEPDGVERNPYHESLTFEPDRHGYECRAANARRGSLSPGGAAKLDRGGVSRPGRLLALGAG